MSNNNFTKQEIEAAEQRKKLIITIGTEQEKADYMAGEICMWNELRQEMDVTEKLLTERQRVLDAIPECNVHGSCVPHAIEWIEEMKAKDYSQEHEALRKKMWIKAWFEYTSILTYEIDQGGEWADKALESFDKRFPKPKE